ESLALPIELTAHVFRNVIDYQDDPAKARQQWVGLETVMAQSVTTAFSHSGKGDVDAVELFWRCRVRIGNRDLIAVGYGAQVSGEWQPGAVHQVRIKLRLVGASTGQGIKEQIVLLQLVGDGIDLQQEYRIGIGRVQTGDVLEEVVLAGA